MTIPIIYQDKWLIAINKPHGLLVHRSDYAEDAKQFALQELRNHLDRYVYPCHRIDRKTGGVLLFALDEDTLRDMQQMFAHNLVKKKYIAIVRGHTDDKGTIDYALVNNKGKKQEAVTHYKTLSKSEIEISGQPFPTSRYSLVEMQPQTGRMHQIRKHMAHIFHPIIGDRPHGCNKQNKLFKERWIMATMLLHAFEIQFNHPEYDEKIAITASLQDEFRRMINILQLKY